MECKECRVPYAAEDENGEIRLCEAHEALRALSCPPTPEEILNVNTLLQALYARRGSAA